MGCQKSSVRPVQQMEENDSSLIVDRDEHHKLLDPKTNSKLESGILEIEVEKETPNMPKLANSNDIIYESPEDKLNGVDTERSPIKSFRIQRNSRDHSRESVKEPPVAPRDISTHTIVVLPGKTSKVTVTFGGESRIDTMGGGSRMSSKEISPLTFNMSKGYGGKIGRFMPFKQNITSKIGERIEDSIKEEGISMMGDGHSIENSRSNLSMNSRRFLNNHHMSMKGIGYDKESSCSKNHQYNVPQKISEDNFKRNIPESAIKGNFGSKLKTEKEVQFMDRLKNDQEFKPSKTYQEGRKLENQSMLSSNFDGPREHTHNKNDFSIQFDNHRGYNEFYNRMKQRSSKSRFTSINLLAAAKDNPRRGSIQTENGPIIKNEKNLLSLGGLNNRDDTEHAAGISKHSAMNNSMSSNRIACFIPKPRQQIKDLSELRSSFTSRLKDFGKREADTKNPSRNINCEVELPVKNVKDKDRYQIHRVSEVFPESPRINPDKTKEKIGSPGDQTSIDQDTMKVLKKINENEPEKKTGSDSGVNRQQDIRNDNPGLLLETRTEKQIKSVMRYPQGTHLNEDKQANDNAVDNDSKISYVRCPSPRAQNRSMTLAPRTLGLSQENTKLSHMDKRILSRANRQAKLKAESINETKKTLAIIPYPVIVEDKFPVSCTGGKG